MHADVHDRLCDALAALADAAVVGDGMDDATQFGPLQNRAQYERVRMLRDAAAQHGTVLTRNVDVPAQGYFIRPTVIRDLRPGVRLVDEEQFGPVLPVIKVRDAEEALAWANDTPYGLGGSVWSADEARGIELAGRLEAGTVWVNKHQDIAPHLPFAGTKYSGIGVEFGLEGVLEFTQTQVINLRPAAR